MRYSFDLLNDMFDWFVADSELMSLLGIDTTADDALDVENNKLRREYQTDTNVSADDIPFISYYMMHSDKTNNNFMVNVGDLYFDVYTDTMYKAGEITKRIREVIRDKTEIKLLYEGQHYSGVNGVYKYRLIFNPLIYGG